MTMWPTVPASCALAMLGRRRMRRRVTLGVDKASDVAAFVDALRDRGVTPHIAVDGPSVAALAAGEAGHPAA